jgi:hypothetical protein
MAAPAVAQTPGTTVTPVDHNDHRDGDTHRDHRDRRQQAAPGTWQSQPGLGDWQQQPGAGDWQQPDPNSQNPLSWLPTGSMGS